MTISAISPPYGMPQLSSFAPTGPEKLNAACALEKNPASVITTWIADKNLFGSSMSFTSVSAFLFPSCANDRTRFLFTDTMAISAAAKYALTRISTSNKIS